MPVRFKVGARSAQVDSLSPLISARLLTGSIFGRKRRQEKSRFTGSEITRGCAPAIFRR